MTTTAQRSSPASPVTRTAGYAVSRGARTRDRWLAASDSLAQQLLAEENTPPLHLVAEALLVGADAYCAVVLAATSEGGHLQALVCLGPRADQIAAHLLADASPLPRHVSHPGEPLHVLPAGTADHLLLLPLPGAGGSRAVLAAVRFDARRGFTLEDLRAAGGFAYHAGALAELATVRAAQQRRAIAELRERVAAELHGQISQDLYLAGLAVYGVAAGLGPGPLADRLAAATTELDRLIGKIRATAHDVAQVPPCPPDSLRARLLSVVADLAPTLGFEPSVELSGRTRDAAAFQDVFDDVVAGLRGLLTTRHRDGTDGLTVALDIIDGHLTLDVIAGGSEPGGTRLLWPVPTP